MKLINAYSTLREPPAPDFPHRMKGKRDVADPELASHLDRFADHLASRSGDGLTQTVSNVIRHVRRVNHQYCFTIDEKDIERCSEWAVKANAIFFTKQGSVCDPWLKILVPADGDTQDTEARLPFPEDARQRKARTESELERLGIHVPESLPPVVSEHEVNLRDGREAAIRSQGLWVVALRAESLVSADEIPVTEIRKDFPIGADNLTDSEEAFLQSASPTEQDLVNFSWRYEALFLLQWALGLYNELPFPSAICRVPAVARCAIYHNNTEAVESATLRSTPEILDSLDLHYRLHWAVRQARLDKRKLSNVENGVVAERHYALNWLVRFENRDWDCMDTPT